MKKIILHIIAVTALLFTWSGYLFAQMGTIEGIVREGPEGNINTGFNITFQGPPGSEITTYNSIGRYIVSAPIESTVTLVVSLEGYPDLEKNLTVGSGIHFMNFWFNPPTLPSDFDGNYYNTVTIGTQTWMAENLKVTHFSDGTNIPNVTDNGAWTGLSTSGYCWYDNNYSTYKDIYGALYNWFTVSEGNICPIGWHVPTEAEWHQMILSLDPNAGSLPDESLIAGGKLKEAGTAHWPDNLATGESGFVALPGGGRYVDSEHSGVFEGIPWYGYYWSSTEDDHNPVNNGVGRYMIYNDNKVVRLPFSKKSGFSVRCINDILLPTVSTAAITSITPISALSGGDVTSDGGAAVTERGICWSTSEYPTTADSKTFAGSGTGSFISILNNLTPNTTYYVRAYAINSAGTSYGNQENFTTIQEFGLIIFNSGSTYGTVTDIEGNPYQTIQIGSQLWMAENLKTTHYNDNTEVPNLTDVTAWDAEDGSEGHNGAYCWYENNAPIYRNAFGALYNWYAVNTGKLCPAGWHVPSDEEWTTLSDYLGGVNVAGGNAKETGTTHWTEPNTGATNGAGFTALPGGIRITGGTFLWIRDQGMWWSSSEDDSFTTHAWDRQMAYEWSGVGKANNPKKNGHSVRCMRNIEQPTVTTTSVGNISTSSAQCGGNITDEGSDPVTARGVCWNTAGDPTLDDNHTTDGEGIGSFTSSIAPLTANTTYSVRAYATNSAGTSYGEEITFTTYKADAITDFDGNYYNIVKIGSQYWLQENLKVLNYGNGDPIPNVTDQAAWNSLTSGAYCNYNNDESKVGIYGRLYNAYATEDNRKLCPTGWHVPSENEWIVLENYLIANGYNYDGTTTGNKIAKSMASDKYWQLSSVEGAVGNPDYTAYRNKSGFTGLPAGFRYPDNSSFQSIGAGAVWWSSTDKDATHTVAASIWSDWAYETRTMYGGGDDKRDGFSIRCTYDPLVTNTNDSGIGSLRDAVEYANSTSGFKETITFNIPGTGPFTIQPLSQLPVITDPVVIDGYSQPGAKPATDSEPATILIEIDGNALGSAAGLNLDAGNSTISGLSIKGFQTNMTLGTNGNNIIKGNYFSGSEYTNWNIYIHSSNNEIGGRSPAARNVIIGAGSGDGIEINNVNSNFTGSNRIIGNYIGVDSDGESGRGNYFAGISIIESPDNIIGGPDKGEGNVISGNIAGINISGADATGNRIEGNYIGTNASGTRRISNDRGIYVVAPGNFIGGSTPGTGNLISGNGGPGGGSAVSAIYLSSDAVGNVIQGNMIGTDQTGYKAIPNLLAAAIIIDGGKNNLIGGLESGARNIISGNNEDGILIVGSEGNLAEGNKIQGNYIGTDISGKATLGNKSAGIVFGDYALNNNIGGTEPGAGNIIAFNEGAGVTVGGAGDPGTGNAILTNLIHTNGELGIDLVGGTEDDFGVTENNAENEGPNNLQHYPVIESITYSRGEVIITGSLNSAAVTNYTIQFFASKLVDESGYGEGQEYLGSATVLTNSYGIAPFSVTFSRSTSAEVFTATATDPDGNTSEFSMAIGGLASQELSPGNFSYRVNGTGVPNVPALNVEGAVDESFKTWSNVTNASGVKTAGILFDDGGTSTEEHASYDEINLVTFSDNEYDIPWGVLAIAAKTWQVDQQTNTAQIMDADIVVNPFFVNHPTYNLGIEGEGTYDGYFDIQSVITHEIGHVLGLLHSGLINSTMWFQIGEGTSVRDLVQDDKSWASYKYPTTDYNSIFGSISGNIKYGYDITQPVAGALVLAINTSTNESVHAYSDADGYYEVPGLIPESYNIFIESLDGDVNGEELWPGNISEYIGSNTIYLDYPGEYYSTDEGAEEVNDTPLPVTVSAAGQTYGPYNIITNNDITHPTVELVKPTLTSGDMVNVLSNFNIRFSEPVDMETLTGATCYLSSEGTTETVTGSVTKPYSEYPSTVLFDPATDLKHNETYTLHLTTGILDMRENSLENEYTQEFNTVPLDETAPSINEVIPADDSINVFISSTVKLIFSEPMNMSSVEEGFALTWTEEGTTNTVDGSFSWRDYNKMVTFTPSGYLKEGTEYTISVSDAATDLSGNPMESSRSFTFTTVGEAAPVILYLGPANNSIDVTINTPVVVDFSEPINTSSVNPTTFKLLLGANPIAGTYEFFNENSTVVFRPLAYLADNQNYTIILTDGITDVSQPNSNLANTTTTTFETAAIVSEPTITYLDPTYGVANNAVTIAGSGFDPNPALNAVRFNGIEAVITKAYLTSLEVIVPAITQSVSVTVEVSGEVSNSVNFDLLNENWDPAGYATANAPIGKKSTHGSDVTPEGAFAYVTNPEEGTVSVVDMNTLDVETIMIGEGKYPLMIDINPEGTKAYVTNFYSSDVSVIDLEPGDNYNTVIKNISVGIGPYGVAVTPDGQRVYVANYYSGSLSMIDADPTSGGYDHATANVPIGKNPTVTKANPDGALVLVVGDFGLMIVNSDPSNKDEYNSATANITIGKKFTAATTTPEGAYAIASTDDGYLLLIDLYPENGDYSDAVLANVKTGSNPSDIKARGDNAYVYLTDTDGDRILVYKIGAGGTGGAGSSMPSGIGMTLVYETEIPVGDAPQSLVIDADRLYVVDGDPSEPEVRRVTVIQFGLLSLSNGFSDLKNAIQGMIDAGDIKPANGKNIIRKLEDAQKYLDAGKTKNALNSLNAAGNMIKALMNSHQITADQGNYLLNMLNLIIAEIDNDKKSGEIDYYNVDLEQPVSDLIAETKLGVIYPNPTRETITIIYEIAESDLGSEKVTIQIYDVIGRLVGNLVNRNQEPGRYTAIWTGYYDNGGLAPRGIYFIRFSAGKVNEVKQIMLVR